MIVGLDHVQIAAPEGCEDDARRFFGRVLGLAEIPKPEGLAARGGVWFACGDQELHVGVEPGFRPARKAHPAFRVEDAAALRARLAAAGVEVTDDASRAFRRRFYADDPWGNRLEFAAPPPLAAAAAGGRGRP